MGDQMNQYEYAKEHAGYTSIEYRLSRKKALLVGYSEIHEDELFYYCQTKEGIEGPFYFKYPEKAKQLFYYRMNKSAKAKEVLAERKMAV